MDMILRIKYSICLSLINFTKLIPRQMIDSGKIFVTIKYRRVLYLNAPIGPGKTTGLSEPSLATLDTPKK